MSELSPPRRWSNVFFGLSWFVIGFAVITMAQVVVAIGLGLFSMQEAGGEFDEAALGQAFLDGDLVAFAFPLALLMVLALVAFSMRRRRRNAFEYLALVAVSRAVLVRWGAATVLLMLLSYAIGLASGRPEIPEWLELAYPSVDHGIAFGLSIVVFGPLLEEVLYRGYILRTWLESPLNRVSAIMVLSLLWTATHLQYDVYDMAWVFILGVLLAYARLATGSLYPPLLMHMLWNLAALVQLQWYFSHARGIA